MMDTRRWGPGERMVFETYTQAMYETTFAWIAERGIFPENAMGVARYPELIAAASRV